MPKTWLIADTHFGHSAIVGYEQRPFADAAQMDEQLISNWNSAVGPEDQVFMLGDFALAPAGRVKELLATLHGRKTLILGNHDRGHSVSWWLEAGFAWASPYPILLDEFFMLSHEPLYVNANMPYANIFGHVHGNPAYRDCSGQHFCVSAERIGYAPIDFAKVKEAIAQARAAG